MHCHVTKMNQKIEITQRKINYEDLFQNAYVKKEILGI